MVIITGVSSGIGKALAELYLDQGQAVVGIGRNNVIEAPNYSFLRCDLSELEAIDNLVVDISSANELIFINNAGTLGDIGRISQQESSTSIQSVMTINTIAPVALMQKVLHSYPKEKPLALVNISSGAAHRAIPSWASYCASKAALDMYSKTIYLEEKELGRNLKIYSVAPGVVDTPMQGQIRETSKSDFSSVDTFIAYKQKKELVTPKEVALKLDKLLRLPYTEEVIYSLRNITA